MDMLSGKVFKVNDHLDFVEFSNYLCIFEKFKDSYKVCFLQNFRNNIIKHSNNICNQFNSSDLQFSVLFLSVEQLKNQIVSHELIEVLDNDLFEMFEFLKNGDDSSLLILTKILEVKQNVK